MAWDGRERRSGRERRLVERRRTMNYNSQTIVIIEGVTWVDAEGADRRRTIRRREDRELIATKILRVARP